MKTKALLVICGLAVLPISAFAQGKSWSAEERYFRLDEVYRRNRDPRILKELLSTRSDGAGAEAVRWVRLNLLKDFPHTVLCSVVVNRRNYSLLMTDLVREGSEELRTPLSRMRRSKFKAVRRAAFLGQQNLELGLKVHKLEKKGKYKEAIALLKKHRR